MVTPVIEQGAMSVTGYFPSDNWYDYNSGKQITYKEEGSRVGNWLTFNVPWDDIKTHIRG